MADPKDPKQYQDWFSGLPCVSNLELVCSRSDCSLFGPPPCLQEGKDVSLPSATPPPLPTQDQPSSPSLPTVADELISASRSGDLSAALALSRSDVDALLLHIHALSLDREEMAALLRDERARRIDAEILASRLDSEIACVSASKDFDTYVIADLNRRLALFSRDSGGNR